MDSATLTAIATVLTHAGLRIARFEFGYMAARRTGEASSYRLSHSIEILWLEDGDHDFRPRKTVTGLTAGDHLRRIAVATAAWTARLPT